MSQKTALHINTYFLSNKIHYYFYKCILKKRNDQFLLPVYRRHFKTRDIPEVDIDYVFGKTDMVVFVTKIWKVIRLYYKKRYVKFDYIHAHTIIANGLPAWILSRLNKVNFVVSVRKADFELFIDKNFIFKLIGHVILNRAKLIFCISPSLQSRLLKKYPTLDKKKICLLPNGLDPYWLEKNKRERKVDHIDEHVRLLFVGHVNRNKNLDVLFEFMKKEHPWPCTLTIVGEKKMKLDFEEINKKLPQKNKIEYLGKISDKERLKEVYDLNDIFVLLSKEESFGVVYIEAMSCGLPIIYSQGRGVDGFFKEGEVGFSCDNSSPDELFEKVSQIIPDYRRMSENAYSRSRDFNWESIIDNYIKIIEKETV